MKFKALKIVKNIHKIFKIKPLKKNYFKNLIFINRNKNLKIITILKPSKPLNKPKPSLQDPRKKRTQTLSEVIKKTQNLVCASFQISHFHSSFSSTIPENYTTTTTTAAASKQASLHVLILSHSF
jgi:hypothetical protein